MPSDRTSCEVACSHCGLPVPTGLIQPEAPSFCCAACEQVYAIIGSLGLDRYYVLRERLPGTRRRAVRRGREYAEFDDTTFARLHVRSLPSGARRIELYLEGVHCAACIWLVERLPRVLPGVLDARLDLGRARAVIDWDPEQVSLSMIARQLDGLGYPSHPFRGRDAALAAERERRTLWIRLAISGACAGNVMLISFALYGGLFHGIEPEYHRLLRCAALLVSIPALWWGAGGFFRNAASALRRGRLHIDLPVSVGILAGFGHGAWSVLTGGGEIYLDSVTMLIFLLLAGRLLERGQQRKAAEAGELLHSLSPTRATLIDGDGERSVLIEALLPGMRIRVRGGELIPADGTVRAGEGELDRSLMTGESRPVRVSTGDRVEAGATHLSGALDVEVEEVGEKTRLGRLLQSMEEIARRRAPVVRLADRLAGVFVAAVLLAALLTAVIVGRDSPSGAIDRALALLIVTCPCALALATPLAVAAALGRAARLGILIRGGDVLERLCKPGTIWFDKTGTLTRGRMERIAWEGSAELERAVAAVEDQVAHPIAVAFRRAVPGVLPIVTGISALPGGGVSGMVEGTSIVIGAPGAVVEMVGADTDHPLCRAAMAHAAAGRTPVLIAWAGSLAGLAAFGDPIRSDARAVVERWRARGWRVGLLSGDAPDVARAVGTHLGIPIERCLGGVTPEGKLAHIQGETAAGISTVMVGDGVNDAAALAAATVGIAIEGGAAAALRAADAFVTGRRLGAVADLLEGAHRTIATIRIGLGFSLAYNAVGAALAMSGLLHPLVAAVLMPLSSLTVVTLSFRARTFDPPRADLEDEIDGIGAVRGEVLPCR